MKPWARPLAGRLEEREIESAALRDNPLGDPSVRPIFVYLPPAYDQVLKCSHTFNLLDARGAISVTERAAYIRRVRALARRVAQLYVELERGEDEPGEAGLAHAHAAV